MRRTALDRIHVKFSVPIERSVSHRTLTSTRAFSFQNRDDIPHYTTLGGESFVVSGEVTLNEYCQTELVRHWEKHLQLFLRLNVLHPSVDWISLSRTRCRTTDGESCTTLQGKMIDSRVISDILATYWTADPRSAPCESVVITKSIQLGFRTSNTAGRKADIVAAPVNTDHTAHGTLRALAKYYRCPTSEAAEAHETRPCQKLETKKVQDLLHHFDNKAA